MKYSIQDGTRKISVAIWGSKHKNITYSKFLIDATLVLEDKRFLSHIGIDFIAIVRSVFHLMCGRPRGGASTIDMQLARTVTGYRERTPARKFYELLIAIQMRRKFAPGDILNAYLTIAYFGAGLTGATEASMRLFGKPADKLDLEQAAVVASLLVYPMPREPSTLWYRRVRQRALYGLRKLHSSTLNLEIVWSRTPRLNVDCRALSWTEKEFFEALIVRDPLGSDLRKP